MKKIIVTMIVFMIVLAGCGTTESVDTRPISSEKETEITSVIDDAKKKVEESVDEVNSDINDVMSDIDDAASSSNIFSDDMTLGQQNAIKSAQSYLKYSAFSRAGLIEQLTSEYGEGFETDEAEFAIAYLEDNNLVDWNEQAVESGKSYLSHSAFSKAGLIEQLTSEYGEGFTQEEAEYAANQVGY